MAWGDYPILTGVAYLNYDDPRRVTLPATERRRAGSWWLVADVPGDFAAYWRWWAARALGIRIERNSWPDHITVVGGVEPPNRAAWKRHNKRLVRFEFEHDVSPRPHARNPFLYVRCRSADLEAIRVELGFEAYYPFHVTLGEVVDWQWQPDPDLVNMRKFIQSLG